MPIFIVSLFMLSNIVYGCQDLESNCTASDCLVRPGYGLIRCRKTCENCDGQLCFDSQNVNCHLVDPSKCEIEPLLHQYCPILCGICNMPKVVVSPSASRCEDERPDICKGVTPSICRAHPGYYFQLCPKTCETCDTAVCIDSDALFCWELKKKGACNRPMVQEYCPRTCLVCQLEAALSPHGDLKLVAMTPAKIIRDCKDERQNCAKLAHYGWCFHLAKRNNMKKTCAKTCGHCRE